MRNFVLLLITLPLFMAFPAFAQQQQPDWDKVPIKVQRLSGNVYMLQGVGGNITAFAGDDGLILVDCEEAELGPKIEAALKTISDKPVKYVLNTHWHSDHTGGNAYFGKTSIIIAQDNVRKKMERDPRIANVAVSLPVITYSDQWTLHVKGGEVRSIYFPKGHTDGDSVVFFPAANVISTGDDFSNWNPPHFPSIDRDEDGSGGVSGEIAANEYVLAHVSDDAKVVPGHGDLASREDVAKYLAVLKGTSAAVQAGINQGKSLDQLKQEKVLAKWDYLETSAPGGMKSDVYLEHLYHSLLSQKSDAKSGSRR